MVCDIIHFSGVCTIFCSGFHLVPALVVLVVVIFVFDLSHFWCFAAVLESFIFFWGGWV